MCSERLRLSYCSTPGISARPDKSNYCHEGKRKAKVCYLDNVHSWTVIKSNHLQPFTCVGVQRFRSIAGSPFGPTHTVAPAFTCDQQRVNLKERLISSSTQVKKYSRAQVRGTSFKKVHIRSHNKTSAWEKKLTRLQPCESCMQLK